MLLSLRKNGLDSLFKEVRVLKETVAGLVLGWDVLNDPCPIRLDNRGTRQWNLVNLFLTNLVRISGFSSLFPAIAVSLCPPTRLLKKCCDCWENQENTEILAKLVRTRLTRK